MLGFVNDSVFFWLNSDTIDFWNTPYTLSMVIAQLATFYGCRDLRRCQGRCIQLRPAGNRLIAVLLSAGWAWRTA